jgi:hypothetical protein
VRDKLQLKPLMRKITKKLLKTLGIRIVNNFLTVHNNNFSSEFFARCIGFLCNSSLLAVTTIRVQKTVEILMFTLLYLTVIIFCHGWDTKDCLKLRNCNVSVFNPITLCEFSSPHQIYYYCDECSCNKNHTACIDVIKCVKTDTVITQILYLRIRIRIINCMPTYFL